MADPNPKGLPQDSSTSRGRALQVVAANSPTATQKPKLLDQVRHAIRLRPLTIGLTRPLRVSLGVRTIWRYHNHAT
jgi:hypothetical protein